MSLYITISALVIPQTFAWFWDRYSQDVEESYEPCDQHQSSRDPSDLICPHILEGTPISGADPFVPNITEYNSALLDLDINSVFQDIVDLLVDSQDCWPADTINVDTNYGGFFIRLAWHCSGTYRSTDGVGGCAGGRIRYYPEASWDDNVQLDKARALLYPIKEKYGDSLSWGDLMVFAGTASIYALGGPVTQICAGRIDEEDGTNSLPLGISGDPLSANPPCIGGQGNCNQGNDIIGASTVGLIYVNPQGVNGIPDPIASAIRIREIFGRMGNNDTETVALIGGGHAFGKSHGACKLGAGPNPDIQPENPWPGLCNVHKDDPIGRGKNTFSSGIEGQWTTYPFKWDNEYFQLLRDYGRDYQLINGSGGALQWKHPHNDLMMMTTDLALYFDRDYREIVHLFAEDLYELDRQFAAVWEKLTTNGGEWAENKFCIDANELDLDLDEMPGRKDYYNYYGKRINKEYKYNDNDDYGYGYWFPW